MTTQGRSHSKMGSAHLVPKEKRTGPNRKADHGGQSTSLGHIAEAVTEDRRQSQTKGDSNPLAQGSRPQERWRREHA
jgi:hypothetical protein